MSWVAISGFVVAVIMVAQQLVIMYQHRNDDAWAMTANSYRRHIKVAALLGTLTWVVLLALLIYDLTLTQQQLLPGYGDFLTHTQAPALLLLTAFFTGCIRLFVEQLRNEALFVRNRSPGPVALWKRYVSRLIDPNLLWEFFYSFWDSEKLIESDKEIRLTDSDTRRRHDAWLWSFVVTTFLALTTVVVGKSLPPPAEQSMPPPALLFTAAILINSIALLGYFAWLYVGIFTKLTEVHSFSGKTARYFIGSFTDKVTPRQVVLIGPKGAGKTAFLRGDDRAPKEEILNGKEVGTLSLRLRMYTARDSRSNKEIAKIAAIDTPGENVGDHIMITARFRADTLVLILNVGMIDLDQASIPANYADLELLPNVFGNQTADGKYLLALWFATNRDPQSLPAGEVFKVRSFVLYLNHRDTPTDRAALAAIGKTHLIQRMAELIGDRFGVHPDRCCVIGGKAPFPAQGRDILGYQETRDRVELARWGVKQTGGIMLGDALNDDLALKQREVNHGGGDGSTDDH